MRLVLPKMPGSAIGPEANPGLPCPLSPPGIQIEMPAATVHPGQLKRRVPPSREPDNYHSQEPARMTFVARQATCRASASSCDTIPNARAKANNGPVGSGFSAVPAPGASVRHGCRSPGQAGGRQACRGRRHEAEQQEGQHASRARPAVRQSDVARVVPPGAPCLLLIPASCYTR